MAVAWSMVGAFSRAAGGELDRPQPGGPDRRHQARPHRDEHRPGVDQDDGEVFDVRRDFVEVVDAAVEELLAGLVGDPGLDGVDVEGDGEADDGAEAAADHAQEDRVPDEDAEHAAVAGPEGFQDADVAVFFADDHREDGQDAEPGDADDHEQQQVQDTAFNIDGGQERPLGVFPGDDVRLAVVLEEVLHGAGDVRLDELIFLCGGLGGEFHLQAVDLAVHPPQPLEFFEGQIDELIVVLAHLAFEVVRDDVGAPDRTQVIPGERGDHDGVADFQQCADFDSPIGASVADVGDHVADDDADRLGGWNLGQIRLRDDDRRRSHQRRGAGAEEVPSGPRRRGQPRRLLFDQVDQFEPLERGVAHGKRRHVRGLLVHQVFAEVADLRLKNRVDAHHLDVLDDRLRPVGRP
jgi:hypothetical protein